MIEELRPNVDEMLKVARPNTDEMLRVTRPDLAGTASGPLDDDADTETHT